MVIGTEVLYQSFVWNIGVEMVSPVAWTLREVCTVQPLCRSIRFDAPHGQHPCLDRAKLATNPEPTGSPADTMTMGTVEVAK
jgi:hypothetical protein